MGSRIREIIKILVPAILALALLYFAFRNVEFSEFVQKSKTANYWWVIASIIASLISYILRAYRWNLLLQPLGYSLTVYRTTLSVLTGYLANLAFPRLGEVTRCAVLNRTDKVPIPISIGSVISERLIDALTLLLLLGVSFLMEYDLILTFFQQTLKDYNIPVKPVLLGIGIVSALSVVFVLAFFKNRSRRVMKIRVTLRKFGQGIVSVLKMENSTGFILSTIGLWVLYYIMAYIIVFSLEETSSLSLSAGFMLLVVGGIAISLPVQAGIGTYHAMVTALLVMYGIDETTGLFLATLLHTSQIIAVAIFGGIAVLLAFLITKGRNDADKK